MFFQCLQKAYYNSGRISEGVEVRQMSTKQKLLCLKLLRTQEFSATMHMQGKKAKSLQSRVVR